MITNITNYRNTGDWFYLVTATLLVDLVVIFLAKYPGPNTMMKVGALNEWYDKFGIAAVGSDVLSILIVTMLTRYIYTGLGFKGPLWFMAILLLLQIAHDIFFYLAVILPIPKGHNAMIDVFKTYATENGFKILVADSLMMISAVTAASILKGMDYHWTVATSFITLYSLCYVIYTRSP
jgi:hypothetical protein